MTYSDRLRESRRVGSEFLPAVEWVVPAGLVALHARRRGATFGYDRSVMTRYLSHLEKLQIADPTAASELWTRALQLSEQARHVHATDPREGFAAQLAAGTITADGLGKALAKRPDHETASKAAREQRLLLERGARAALLAALQSIFDHSEDGWLSLLRPIAERALATGDDELWNAVHAFAAFLREPRLVSVGGLATIVARDRRGVDADVYMFRRPDRVYRWRVDRAGSAQRHELRKVEQGGIWMQSWALKATAPRPRIAEFDVASWSPGLWSASDGLENIRVALAAQTREFAALAPPDPPEAKPRRRAQFA